MFVRTSYEYFTDRVDKYFKQLLAQVGDLQFFTENGAKGGPIIMTQASFNWSAFIKDSEKFSKTDFRVVNRIFDKNRNSKRSIKGLEERKDYWTQARCKR